MELRDFITTSLTDIMQGIGNANRTMKADGWNISYQLLNQLTPTAGMPVHEGAIEFDVAVAAGMEGTLKGAAGGKVGLSVLGIEAKGEIEGTKRQENVSRIRFKVSYIVQLPAPARPSTALRK